MNIRELHIGCWNTGNNIPEHIICDFVIENELDILLLIESHNIDEGVFIDCINGKGYELFNANTYSFSKKLKFYTSFDPDYIHPISEDESDRFSIRKLALPLSKEILIAGVHLLDQRNYDSESLLEFSLLTKDEIEKVEQVVKNKNTIIFGDFNMNPFENGMTQVNAFNATLSHKIALQKTKTVNKRKYNFFYNPSWSLVGDLYNEPAGTLYYSKPGYNPYYWNMFDQVILRPDLIDNFKNDSYKIIDEINTTSLLDHLGRPNKDFFSDHLPIIFKLINL